MWVTMWRGLISLNDLSPLLSHWNGHQNYNNLCGSSIFTLVFFLWYSLLCDLLECECDLCESHLEDLKDGCEQEWLLSLEWYHDELLCKEDLLWGLCGVSQWDWWLYLLYVELEHRELLLGWWQLSLCHDMEQPLYESWLPELWCLKMQLWPGMTFVWFRLVVLCWGSQRRYPVWTVHYNVTILITFETPNVGAVSCYVSLFLALKTAILVNWHHADHRWWSDGGSQLLYSIELFNFRYGVTECLWSLLMYAGGQTMGILWTLNEYPDVSCIIHEVTSLSLCLEMMDVCCEGLLSSLLDLHEVQGISVDIGITKLQS